MEKLISTIIFITILFISCSKDDTPSIDLKDNSDVLTFEEEQELLDYGGTSCWVVRKSDLDINMPITYEYRSNFQSNPVNYEVAWTIEGGNVEIISGQNTNFFTIKLDDNFEDTKISVTAKDKDKNNSGPLCEVGILITEK